MGVFEPIEEEMVEQVFRMSDQRVSALITPRTEVTWLDLDDPIELNLKKIISSGHSYFPLIKDTPDNTLGYIRAVDLLAQTLRGEPVDFTNILQPAHFVPERVPAFEVLKSFRDVGVEIAFSIDEYGGIEGIVTLQDILETIIGDIKEPEDEDDPNVVRREDGSWLLDGMLTIHDFKKLVDVKELPGDNDQHFETLGGFVMTYLGRIPKSGDTIDLPELHLEVVDMDKHRVDKVLVNRSD
jgi:putative hemolysin